jgi:hypothetical protein
MGVNHRLANGRLPQHEFEGEREEKISDVFGEELKRKEEHKKILHATGHDNVCKESMHVLSFS